jgi:LysR family transcriptional regulator, glycine cleavage system transcriptional activator
MSKKRYDLPPLDLIQGFEAAARNLSFTKAAEELFLTQSAVSRQIKTLEERLGVPLFERRHRALALTEDGEKLLRVATDVLEQVQATVDLLRDRQRLQQVSLTTTAGFASFWLIPRLKRFTAQHPDVDVRISATSTCVNLERSLVDLAIRYTNRAHAPEGATPLFGEEIVVAADLKHHALLHVDDPGMEKTWFDWGTWLTAFGIEDVKPAGALHFMQYDQMIQAAVAGQGVALGRLPLLNDLIRTGVLVAPLEKSVAGTRGYVVIRSPAAARKPQVDAFCDWLFEEARRQ